MPVPEDIPPAEVAPKKDVFFYGGQAVIEGVMMRGRRHYAVAVRLPSTREIVLKRGLALIGEQLHLGMASLLWSVNMNAGEKDIQLGKKEITGSIVTAAIFALLLFFGLPLVLAGAAVHRSNSFLFVIVEGVIRVA